MNDAAAMILLPLAVLLGIVGYWLSCRRGGGTR